MNRNGESTKCYVKQQTPCSHVIAANDRQQNEIGAVQNKTINLKL